MSKNSVILLIYYRHKRLDIIYVRCIHLLARKTLLCAVELMVRA
jgi:hypothetical protein